MPCAPHLYPAVDLSAQWCDEHYACKQVVHMSRKHMGVWLIGVANKTVFVTLVDVTERFEGNFSMISTDLLCLPVAQIDT